MAKILGELDVARMVRSHCRRKQASTVDDWDAPLQPDAPLGAPPPPMSFSQMAAEPLGGSR